MAKQKIGIIGSGDVAKTLGRGFVAQGHETKLSSRTPNKLGGWVKETGELASAGTFDEAAKFGEILVVATLWTGTENALKVAGPDNFKGKVVIDTTNPLKFEGAQAPTLAVGHTDSGAETIQRWLPGAKVVKAFNVVGNNYMVNPKLQDGAPTMWIAGDSDGKKVVTDILHAFGWSDVVDAGPLTGARYIEPLAMLWVDYLFRNQYQRNHAFKLLRK